MCIVISGEVQPDTTKLMNIPVKMKGEQDAYNFFIYVNNFDINKNNTNTSKNRRNVDFGSSLGFGSLLENNNNGSNFASFESNEDFYGRHNFNNSNSNNYSSIMVVPFPVEKNTDYRKIGLVDISTEPMKKLRRDINTLVRPYGSSREMTLGATLSMKNSAPLQVHKIGNYNISVALSVNQLLNRIDWTKFTKPSDFSQRMNTFNNKKLYPDKYNYFYVVAEAVENIKDDGFGIVYPQLNDYYYMPTAHEDTAQLHQFDVETYYFQHNNGKNEEYYPGVTAKTFKTLDNYPVKMLDNSYKKMMSEPGLKTYSLWLQNGMMPNHNDWLKK